MKRIAILCVLILSGCAAQRPPIEQEWVQSAQVDTLTVGNVRYEVRKWYRCMDSIWEFRYIGVDTTSCAPWDWGI